MTEKKIYLDLVCLVDFYGVNNANIQKIKSLFPKLKIVIRGNEISVAGEADLIERFESFINKISLRLNKFNKINENDIELIFHNKMKPENSNDEILVFGTSGKIIKARTENQSKLVQSYYKNDLIFAIGPAGTGKTYLAISLAVRALKNKEVKRIVLSRPAVEAGESLGFLPGDLKDKLDPYLQALYDAMHDMMPGRKLNDYIEQGIVQIAPLAYMRGRTLSDSVVILDEAQNTTTAQIKMFLTRMGENSKFIVTGDVTQIDLPNKKNSGLLKVSKILKNIKGIAFIQFTKADIVRHRLVTPIVDAFEKDSN